MTDAGAVETLLASGIVTRDSGGRLKPGDQSGVLDAPTIESLASRVADLIPKSTTVLLTGPAPADALIAYLVGKQLHLRSVVIYDSEGAALVRGRLPADGGDACFVTAVLQHLWQLEEFDGICRGAGITPGSSVTLLDTLPAADQRVKSVLRIGTD
jgi:hypothetical protein